MVKMHVTTLLGVLFVTGLVSLDQNSAIAQHGEKDTGSIVSEKKPYSGSPSLFRGSTFRHSALPFQLFRITSSQDVISARQPTSVAQPNRAHPKLGQPNRTLSTLAQPILPAQTTSIPLVDESHIEAVAHRYWDTQTEAGEWVLVNTIQIERNAQNLPITVTETYRYVDEELQTEEYETWTYSAEYTSLNQLSFLSLSTEYEGNTFLFGSIEFTYNELTSKVIAITEILISDLDENLNLTYDTLATEILYFNGTATYQTVYDQTDTTQVIAVEGNSLIIETFESYLDEDWFTGETIRIQEQTRETYPDLTTLTELWNLMPRLFSEEHTPYLRESYDSETEIFTPEERISYALSEDTVIFNYEWWDVDAEEWTLASEITITFDQDGKMVKRDITEQYGEITETYQDLINPAAEFMQFVSTEEEALQIPSGIQLHQNYPNPFNPSTQLSFDLRESGMVTLEVFDVTGRKVATLLNQPLNAGTHSVNFDATDLASGVYLSRLQFVAAGRANGPAFGLGSDQAAGNATDKTSGQATSNGTVIQHLLMTLIK